MLDGDMGHAILFDKFHIDARRRRIGLAAPGKHDAMIGFERDEFTGDKKSAIPPKV